MTHCQANYHNNNKLSPKYASKKPHQHEQLNFKLMATTRKNTSKFAKLTEK